MAFQTGTATDVDDLIDKIRIFASANGWTVDKYDTTPPSLSSELYLHKGTQYVQLGGYVVTGNNYYHGVYQALDKPTLRLYGSTGFDAGQTINNQPGAIPTSYYARSDWLTGPMTAYYFFVDGDYFHVVVETIPNEFVHFGWGQVPHIGTYNGGVYLTSTAWDQTTNYIDVPNSGYNVTPFGLVSAYTWGTWVGSDVSGVWKWYNGVSTKSNAYMPVGIRGFTEALMQCSPNTFNGLTPMNVMPLGHGLTGELYTIIGQVQDMRFVSVQVPDPGDIVSIGGDDWYFFPANTKRDPSIRDNLPNSGYYGFAYKKVP